MMMQTSNVGGRAAHAQRGHTPVSNQPDDDDDFEIGPEVSSPPDTGADLRVNQAHDGGTEMVSGRAWNLPERAKATVAAPLEGLRDIGEASYGTPLLTETVHGADDRAQINNTAEYPWRVHASLLITAADNSQWIGTGWFIGPHTLVTAGHVVFIKNSGVPGRDGWVKRIIVMPGRNNNQLPFGSVTATSFRSVSGWTAGGGEDFDYGAILLPTPLGNSTGWLGFAVLSDAELSATVANISGYPGDKPTGTQWYDARNVASVTARKVYYDVDSAGGQSGSAAYAVRDGGRFAFAVHAYGGASVNSGTRIVSDVYQNLLAWKEQVG